MSSPPEITNENVEAALRADKGPEADLQSFEVHKFTKQGDNYATMVDRVDVKFSFGGEENTVSYVVKYRPSRLKDYEDFVYALFKKEQAVYEHLLPDIQSQLKAVGLKPLSVPRCFYTSMEKDREVIFLEDLRPRGFRMHDRRKGFDVAHAKLVLEELAKLHSTSHLMESWRTECLQKYPILKVDWTNYAEDAREKTQTALYDYMSSSASVLKDIKGYNVVSDWLTRNRANAADLLEEQLIGIPPFDTLCHGDCWTTNLLFRYNDENLPVEVMLLDFQVCRQASLATDLNYFLLSSLEGDLRKANLEFLLDSYYAAFKEVTEAGKAPMPFTFPQLQEEYRNRLNYSLIMSTYVYLLMISDGDVEDDNINSSAKDLAKNLKSTQRFRTRFLSVFDEVIENKIIA